VASVSILRPASFSLICNSPLLDTWLTRSYRRQFFPPVKEPENAEGEEQTEESELASKLPDAPTTEPTEEGQPEAKRLKITEETVEEKATVSEESVDQGSEKILDKTEEPSKEPEATPKADL